MMIRLKTQSFACGRCRKHGQESGFTLVELMVAISIFLVLSGIVTSVVISLNRSVRKETGFVDAQAQTRLIFEKLDTQIRYASSVYDPTLAADNTTQWIDWEVPDPSLPAPGLRCYQWKSSPSAGTLQYRSWVVPTTAGTVTTPAWTTTYSGLVASSVPVFTTSPSALYASPYVLPSPAPTPSATVATYVPASPQEPQVGVTLTVKANSPIGTSASSTIFTALNAITTAATPSCSSYVARS